MKQNISTINTKKMFVDSLKKMLQTKTLNKISVSDIIKDCNVNHKTFYYHFKDLYDLVYWMFDQEVIETVKAFNMLIDFDEAFLYILSYVKKNKHIINCVYDTMGREQLRFFFYKDFFDVIKKVVTLTIEKNNYTISNECTSFIIESTMEYLVAILINYFKNTYNINEKRLLLYVKTFAKTTIFSCLNEANKNKM